MKFISEYEILDQYKIQEATLTHLQNSGLMPESKSKRGRLVYPCTKQLDLTLRTAKAYYYEISDGAMRLVPCFRAFLAIAIAEGPQAAWSLLTRRGFFDRYDKSEIVVRWKRFKSAVPKELKDFIDGKSDDVTEGVEQLLIMLGIEEVFYAPEKLKMPEIYDQLLIQQDVDALFLAGAKADGVAEMVHRLHHVDLGVNLLESYRFFYFETRLLTGADFAEHLKKFPPSSAYRKLLTLALTKKTVIDFIRAASYPIRLSAEDALMAMLTPIQPTLTANACGPLTEKKRTDDMKNAIHIIEAMEKFASNEDDEIGEDNRDMLRLRHDVSVNENQLVASDIPEEDFDTASSSYRRDDQGEESAGGPA